MLGCMLFLLTCLECGSDKREVDRLLAIVNEDSQNNVAVFQGVPFGTMPFEKALPLIHKFS